MERSLRVLNFFNPVKKSAPSAASPDYVKFQAAIKSAASAASLRGGRASSRLDHDVFSQFLAALAAQRSVEKKGKLACTQKRSPSTPKRSPSTQREVQAPKRKVQAPKREVQSHTPRRGHTQKGSNQKTYFFVSRFLSRFAGT